MRINEVLKNLTHHAHALIGGSYFFDEIILHIEKQYSIKQKANPDFFTRKYSSFSIDDARELKQQHSTRPISVSGIKIFVLIMESITIEAQNALLKLLEEPAQYVRFFIILPSAHLLLPTVKSRMQVITLKSDLNSESNIESDAHTEAKRFVDSSPAIRLEMVKGLMDSITKEKKTKQSAIDLLNAIEMIVHERCSMKEGMYKFKSIEIARKYMNDRSPSLKILLEYVALNI